MQKSKQHVKIGWPLNRYTYGTSKKIFFGNYHEQLITNGCKFSCKKN